MICNLSADSFENGLAEFAHEATLGEPGGVICALVDGAYAQNRTTDPVCHVPRRQ